MDLQRRLISQIVCNKIEQMVVRRHLNLRSGEMKLVFYGTPNSKVSCASSIKYGVVLKKPDGIDRTKENGSTVDPASSVLVSYEVFPNSDGGV